MKRRFSGDAGKKPDGKAAGPANSRSGSAKPEVKDWTKSEMAVMNNPHLPLHRRFVIFANCSF
jgi:hypothetical protein